MFDILIKNALIADGSGEEPFTGDIGINGDMIYYVGEHDESFAAGSVINGDGLTATPGFIDVQSHADETIETCPEMENFISQGITTTVGSNCGDGQAPRAGDGGCSFPEWMDRVDALALGVNFASLVPHNELRTFVTGGDFCRMLTKEEIDLAEKLLCEALDAGAFGMSVSFDADSPGQYAAHNEIRRLLHVLDYRRSVVTAHTRHNENQWFSDDGKSCYGKYVGEPGELFCGRYHGLYEFVEYCADAPRLRAIISHLSHTAHVPYPHARRLDDALADETLRQFVDEPHTNGLDIYFNTLPSPISISKSTKIVDMFLPSMRASSEFSGEAEPEKLLLLLKTDDGRKRIKKFINSGLFKFGMINTATDPYWSDEYVFTEAKNKNLIGKTLFAITNENRSSFRTEILYDITIELLFDLILSDPELSWILTKDNREYGCFTKFLSHPKGMPATDTQCYSRESGDYIPVNAYNMFIRYFTEMVGKHISLEEAVRKVTSLPAGIMAIKKRGLLKEGFFADVTLMNTARLAPNEDFLHPKKQPNGIIHVLVNGTPALTNGKLTDAASGRLLRCSEA